MTYMIAGYCRSRCVDEEKVFTSLVMFSLKRGELELGGYIPWCNIPRLSQTRVHAMSLCRWEPSQVALALIRRPKARAESGSTDTQNRGSRVSSVMCCFSY